MIDTSIQRVEINQVIENQLPEFVQSESPLFVDFMKQYYISQEYQGGPTNIVEEYFCVSVDNPVYSVRAAPT